MRHPLRQSGAPSGIGTTDQERLLELRGMSRPVPGNRRTPVRTGTARAPSAQRDHAAERASPIRTGRTRRACAMACLPRQQLNVRITSQGLRASGARLRPAAALRRLRDDRGRRPQLLRRLLERHRVPRRERVRHVRTATSGDRRATCGVCLAKPPRIERTRQRSRMATLAGASPSA